MSFPTTKALGATTTGRIRCTSFMLQEECTRQAVWLTNMKYIQQHNTKAEDFGYSLAMNHLGDKVLYHFGYTIAITVLETFLWLTICMSQLQNTVYKVLGCFLLILDPARVSKVLLLLQDRELYFWSQSVRSFKIPRTSRFCGLENQKCSHSSEKPGN